MKTEGFRMFSVDRGGWLSIHESPGDAENSISDSIDISCGVYVLVDADGCLYEFYECDDGYYGFRLRKTGVSRPDLVVILQNYADRQKLAPADLAVLRAVLD